MLKDQNAFEFEINQENAHDSFIFVSSSLKYLILELF